MNKEATLLGCRRALRWVVALMAIPLIIDHGVSQAGETAPSRKQIDYNVIFDNAGGSNLTIVHSKNYNAFDACMKRAGPDSIYLTNGEQKSFTVTSSNGAQGNCWGARKYVRWTADGGASNFQFIIKQIENEGWKEGVITSGSGVAPSTALCDGQDCLNKWVPRNTDSPKVSVSFK